jgi:hypothetical protein
MAIELPNLVAKNIDRFTGRAWLLPILLNWYQQSDKRFFLLTGGPGTGKSMILAWLAGFGPQPQYSAAQIQLKQLRMAVEAAHFCQAASRNIAPQALAASIANQLTANVPGFGEALVATLGASLTGISIRRIDIGALGDELSFDRAFSEPLKKLYAGGYMQPMLLLIDALDEAQTYTGSITLIQLLARLNDLPRQIRILVTTRDPRVIKHFGIAELFDLVSDAPRHAHDIRDYVVRRIACKQAIAPEQCAKFTNRLSQAAQGIFLYADMVLNQVLPHLIDNLDLENYPFPDGLSGLYKDFLSRELEKDEDRWYRIFKPLLGLTAVAQGKGLTKTQLQLMTGTDIGPTLRICKQYLTGELPEGPFRSFHKSFADFLLEDESNSHYHIDARSMHQTIVDYYRGKAATWKGMEWDKVDGYGLRYLAIHLAAVGDNAGLFGSPEVSRTSGEAITIKTGGEVVTGIDQHIGEITGGSVTGERRSNVNIENLQNLVIQTSQTEHDSLAKPDIEEKIRVDVAAPERVLVDEVFDLAVAIRRPESPVLVIDDLARTVSAPGTTFRSEPGEIILYRVAVSAPDCVIYGPSEYMFLLRPTQDSEPFFFQLAAKKTGRITILVQAYQEGDIIAAQTRVKIEAYVTAVT